jgi:uncharacterized membrane protein
MADSSFAGFSNNPFIGAILVFLSIIFFSPFLIYSIKHILKKDIEIRFILIFFIITLLLFGAWYIPLGDWCFGPRLELYIICLFSVPFAKNYDSITKNKYFNFLLIISIIITLMSQNFYFWDLQNKLMNYLVSLF